MTGRITNIQLGLMAYEGDPEKWAMASDLLNFRAATKRVCELLAENGCDCDADPPDGSCLACRVERKLFLDGQGPDDNGNNDNPSEEATRV